MIERAIEDNKTPQRSKSSNDLLLPLGNRQYAKLQQRGKTTPAGRFYFAQTKSSPGTFDIQGTLVQRGSTEYLITNGKARVLRRLAGDKYHYTRLGQMYFDAKKDNLSSTRPSRHQKGIFEVPGPQIHGATQRVHATRTRA